MKAHLIEEPVLEFAGSQRHVDPRFGVTEFGPADLLAPGHPRTITVGIIGAQADIEEVSRWLESGREPVAAKDEKHPGLWREFPGFSPDSGYRTELVLDDRLKRPIKQSDIATLEGLDPRERDDAGAELYLTELRTLVEHGRPDVVICHIPDVLTAQEPPETEPLPVEPEDAIDVETVEHEEPPSFHDLLKARAMPLRVPLQLIRSSTFDPKRARRQKSKTWKLRQRQDDASIAWNFFTALYYKAGGTPWRMVRASTDIEACYVGVAFYKTAGGNEIATSVAQVYNQRGDGVVVRGGPAQKSREDRQLHLSEKDAYDVLKSGLQSYKEEHRHLPGRGIVHKTSPFDQHERAGMLAGAKELGLDSLELIWVSNPTTRLFRDGYHAPYRGSMLEMGAETAVLYTRGSVEWYETYAGLYVPRPISLRAAIIERSLLDVATEALSLSKMNWNSTRFDGRLPVTLRTARQVADIIKYVAPDAPVEPTYAYYM